MTKFFNYPFATVGDKTSIPDLAQPDGSVSYQIGFGSDYQLIYPADPSSKAIPRYGFNQLMYDVTSAVQQYQTYGFFEYQTGWIYDIAAVVRYNPGSGILLYQSLVSGNTALPTDTTKWAIFGAAPPPGQYARMTLSGGITSGTPAIVAFNLVSIDPYGITFTSTLTHYIRPTVAGGYRIGSYVKITNLAEPKDIELWLYKNGAVYSILDTVPINTTTTGRDVALSGSDLVEANGTTDYFQIWISYGGTASLTFASNECYFNLNSA